MVTATLTFIKPLPLYDTEKPYFVKIPGDQIVQAFRDSNLEYVPHDGISIEDIREQGLDEFSLAKNGFEILTHQTKPSFLAQHADLEPYCNEITQLVAEKYNAAHAVCYDYRLRRSNLEVTAYEEEEETGRATAAPPVFPVHIDHTVEGGPKRIRRHLTNEEIEKYMSGGYRARIINVWRPIDRIVEDCPLAICDPCTVDTHDLMAADRVTPDFAVEVYYVRFNPNQRWYWLKNQEPNELIAFVNYDSSCEIGGPKWMTCPHAAFKSPEAGQDAPVRSSIEVRLIVFNAIDESDTGAQ